MAATALIILSLRPLCIQLLVGFNNPILYIIHYQTRVNFICAKLQIPQKYTIKHSDTQLGKKKNLIMW